MFVIEIILWLFLAIIVYAYLGYGIVLYALVLIKRMMRPEKCKIADPETPLVTLLIAAYNEKEYVKAKMENSFKLKYPKDKLRILWVTDGSNDGTPDAIRQLADERTTVLHVDARGGKIGAINRAIDFVDSPIVVFSDANTMLGVESIERIARLFADPKVGCVSGEKRVISTGNEAASASEGVYWKYESKLKQLDAELYSVVGAAGELFAVRRELFQKVEPDTLLDDFIISLRIAMQGYTIQYDPLAYAEEHPSANVKEELKRKIRISAGGIQSIIRLLPLLNIFKYRTLSFQYISHRVLRWTLAPLGLPIAYFSSLILFINEMQGEVGLYTLVFLLQSMFYMAVLAGFILEKFSIRIKLIYIPFYFFIMNYAVFLGFRRFIKGKQSVNWERAKRAG